MGAPLLRYEKVDGLQHDSCECHNCMILQQMPCYIVSSIAFTMQVPHNAQLSQVA